MNTNHAAFLAACQGPNDARGPISIQVVCWANLPQAWQALAQAWHSLAAHRADASSTARSKNAVTPPAWLVAAAPRMSEPFNELAAVESSMAALIRRGSITLVVGIGDAPSAVSNPVQASFRAATRAWMNDYEAYLKTPGTRPVQRIVALSSGAAHDKILFDALTMGRTQSSQSHVWRAIATQFGNIDDARLPFELTRLAAAATARRMACPDEDNPVFDAIVTKLNAVPRALLGRGRRKR